MPFEVSFQSQVNVCVAASEATLLQCDPGKNGRSQLRSLASLIGILALRRNALRACIVGPM